MARKRQLQVAREGGTEAQPRTETSWREWALGTYARYWYVMGCFFLDVMVFFQLLSVDIGWLAPLVALAILVVLQVIIYVRIWPRRAPREDEAFEEEDFL